MYLLLLVGAVALVAGLTLQTLQGRPAAKAPAGDVGLGLPSALLGQPASGRQTGAEALQTIESMHGKGFPMANGAVVQYGSATILVSLGANFWLEKTFLW